MKPANRHRRPNATLARSLGHHLGGGVPKLKTYAMVMYA